MACKGFNERFAEQLAEFGDKVRGKHVALSPNGTIVGIGNNPHSAMMNAESEGLHCTSTKYVPGD